MIFLILIYYSFAFLYPAEILSFYPFKLEKTSENVGYLLKGYDF
ncbi:MAG: hypothetical protein KatS3mg089_0972 [Patescibacteria group bacterium]|nr:MAG: hypothetical protein KatS3mg089_0972 [Patescibacteria group bacterium]